MPTRVTFLLSMLIACAIARAQVRYTITDLGNLGQNFAHPYSVNESSEVAGVSFTASGERRGFFWSATGGMVDPTPPGAPGTLPESVAFGVNDAGQAVGWSRPDQNADKLAFVWSASTGLQTIGTLGGSESEARAINNSGQVTGSALTTNGSSRAIRWSAATGMQALGTLGSDSVGKGINESGHVAGFAAVNGQARAFLWRPSSGMVDIGTLGGIGALGHGINNHDQVVGESATAEGGGNLYTHAFRWDPETGMHDLGTLGGTSSIAWGINDAGWVVGYSYLASNEPPVQAFLHDGATMRAINDLIDPSSGWDIRNAYDINNAGQIVAIAAHVDAPWAHAVLLTPIPEPAMSLAGVTTILFASRCRRGWYRRDTPLQ